MRKSISIVGAGISGLAAGCYAGMNGYQATLFESHNLPGGLCTAWRRQDYTIDGCLHWLVGSRPDSPMRTLWTELGIPRDQPMVDHEEFLRVVGEAGECLILKTDADELEQHLLEFSPADRGLIRKFTAAVRKCSRYEAWPKTTPELCGVGEKLRSMWSILPLLGTFLSLGRLSLADFAAQFRDPFLRKAFSSVIDLPDFPLVGLIFTLGWMHARTAGYPVGGSLPFARHLEQRHLELGGEIRYRTKVEKILVEEGRAVGVRLADGSEHRSDYVISAADGHATHFELLEGAYFGGEVARQYDLLEPFPPLIHLALGVGVDLSDEPAAVTWLLEDPPLIAGAPLRKLSARHFCYDPTMAPRGKSVVTVLIPTDYDYWKKLGDDRERYLAEKRRTAQTVIAELERRLPVLQGQIEMVDVATPLTFERYTGNWRGSFEGWLITTKSMRLRMSKTLPGLDGFYLVGQWVQPGGGLPPAAWSGRHAVQLICHEEGKPFVTSTP
jgi:phytoene dehydrogenase-like protein